MDIVTLGAALNGSAEYVNSHFKGGSNIQIVDNPDGTQTINASGEVSSEDTVARAAIAEMKDGTNIDSFGDVETALTTKASTATTYTKTEVDTALSAKADATDIPTVPITAIQKNGTGITPVSGTVNIIVPTQASDINAATATQGGKADTAIQGIKVNSSTVNPDANKVVSITVPTSAADVSALPDTTKYAVALSLTINSSTFVMTGQLKDQNGDNLGTAQTIDLPLESVVVGGSYNSQTKKVVLTLQNGNTIEFSVADLVSGLQTELSASNKLNPAYIDYDSTHAAVTEAQRDQIETNKNNILSLGAEVDTVANLGAKNLLDLSNVVPTVPSGLICTNNGDGTYTVSGTLSSANSIKFAILAIEGELILNGCPSGGGDSSYMQRITKNGTAVANTIDAGSGSNSFTMSGTGYELNFRFAAGTYTNVMFKPMLRPASISDSTYQSYAMSNAELTAAIQALQAQLSNQ